MFHLYFSVVIKAKLSSLVYLSFWGVSRNVVLRDILMSMRASDLDLWLQMNFLAYYIESMDVDRRADIDEYEPMGRY